jgi:hypothetical protein
MRHASFFLSRLTRQAHDQRLRFSRNERVQSLFNFLQSGKFVKTRTISPQLTDGLWPAKHEHTHDRHLGFAQVHNFGHDVFVLRDAAGAAVKNVSQVFLAQGFQCLRHFGFRVGCHRVAIVLLITCECQGIKCQWIILGRGDLLFYQASQHTHFNVIQDCCHLVDIHNEGNGFAVRCAEVAMPFRQRQPNAVGLRPVMGHSPKIKNTNIRRGRATAAHQAAQPFRKLHTSAPSSKLSVHRAFAHLNPETIQRSCA